MHVAISSTAIQCDAGSALISISEFDRSIIMPSISSINRSLENLDPSETAVNFHWPHAGHAADRMGHCNGMVIIVALHGIINVKENSILVVNVEALMWQQKRYLTCRSPKSTQLCRMTASGFNQCLRHAIFQSLISNVICIRTFMDLLNDNDVFVAIVNMAWTLSQEINPWRYIGHKSLISGNPQSADFLFRIMVQILISGFRPNSSGAVISRSL